MLQSAYNESSTCVLLKKQTVHHFKWDSVCYNGRLICLKKWVGFFLLKKRHEQTQKNESRRSHVCVSSYHAKKCHPPGDMLCRRDFACAPLLEPNGLRAWPPWMTKRFRKCHSCWDCRFFCEEIGWSDSFADPIFPLVLISVCFLSETKSGRSYLPE